jgi:hypothetical protein
MISRNGISHSTLDDPEDPNLTPRAPRGVPTIGSR